MIRIVCLSGTHGLHRAVGVPLCEVLIFAGDMTAKGTGEETVEFLRWLEAHPHPAKVIVAGNHDWIFEREPELARELVAEHAPSATYLQDSGAEIAGLRFWGSPVQPRFLQWAFNREREEDIRRHWSMIPADTEVLVTHGPPRGFLDSVAGVGPEGCQDLRAAVDRLKHLCLSVFGHLHKDGGRMVKSRGKIFANASVCDEKYIPFNEPVVVSISPWTT